MPMYLNVKIECDSHYGLDCFNDLENEFRIAASAKRINEFVRSQGWAVTQAGKIWLYRCPDCRAWTPAGRRRSPDRKSESEILLSYAGRRTVFPNSPRLYESHDN